MTARWMRDWSILFIDNSVENRYCCFSDSPLEAIYNGGNHHYKNNKEIITQMSSPVNNSPPGRPSRPAWYQSIAKFEKPNILKSSWQIINTLIPYFFLWYVMVRAMQAGYPYWVILLLTAPAGLFMVRLFILFHDCAHQSFFSSKRANQLFGYISGVLTFAAYEKWRAAHWRHHATVADLDRRGSGDFWIMTKDEYLESSKWKRWVYRLARNPFIVFGLGPIFIFLVYQRFPIWAQSKKERNSVYFTNLGIIGIVLLVSFVIGFRTYILIQLPILFIGGMVGLWLFYIQHNFEGVYWSRHDDWDRMKAALKGSSFYKLPKVLQWFTGNIGYHHIHHVRPMIPNYTLEACSDSEPELQRIKPLTLRKSLLSLRLHLWDEINQKLVSFRSLKKSEA
jgi:omega-6 fatty acid desaturase (delta-12 desaturase)